MVKSNYFEHAIKTYKSVDCVKSVKTNHEKETVSIQTVFSLHGFENNCELIYKNRELISRTCDCRWMKEYGECPHTYMMEDYISKFKLKNISDMINPKFIEIEKNINNYKQRKLLRDLEFNANQDKDILKLIKNKYQTKLSILMDENEYELEPVINTDYSWKLSFKVGKDKKYVVKSLNEFINLLDNKKEKVYGKNLVMVHDIDKFTDLSEKTIQMIRKYCHKQDNYDDKSLVLEGSLLDEFYDLYENTLDFREHDLTRDKMHMTCKKVENYYIFEIENKYENFEFGEKHFYYFNNSKINRMKFDDSGITSAFLKQCISRPFVVNESDYKELYKYVLSTVQLYADLELSEEIEEEIIEKTELYGDISDNNTICFNLYYYNDQNIRFNGFDKNRVLSLQQDIVENYLEKYASYIDETTHTLYMNIHDEKTIDFISDGLLFLKDYCDIYVSENLKKLGKKHQYSISVGVKYINDLLSLSVESNEIPKEELTNVLNAYRKKKKFYRLKNGELLNLDSDELMELDTFLDEYHVNPNDMNKGKLELAPYRLFSLNEKADNESLLTFNREKSFTKLIDSYFENKKVKISEHYDNILRDYQKDGVSWLNTLRNYHFNGILADDMGLGKTLQVIAYLESNSACTSVVVCPASLIYNWNEEVHKFSESLNCACVTGPQDERIKIINDYKKYDLLITSYDYIKRDIEYYNDITFDTVILDEAQYIKNQNTQNAISVKKLKAEHKIALTGTPIENTLAELWSIFDFLMPDYLFNYHFFKNNYEKQIVLDKDEETMNKLKQLVTPFILRRTKKEVLKELPDKIEKTRMIEFNTDERKLYLANLNDVNKEFKKLSDKKNNKIEILALLTRLRQICCEPRLVYENIETISSKLSDCIELIEELNMNKQKILLFSSFTSILDLVETELKRKNITYYKLTGSTNKEERRELVDKFQNDNTSVFLISLKAGGTGLNLTAAEAVIHFDPWWNVSAQNQATDRAYRIGQNKNVQVFKLIMKDSIEEKIMKLQENKKELADTFVENNEGSISSMSKEELMDLFKM